MTHTDMLASAGEERESTSSDFPPELSSELSPTELSDIEIDDDQDSLFTDSSKDNSPLSSSDYDVREHQHMQNSDNDTKSKKCVLSQLEKLESQLRQLDEMLQTQRFNIEEVEKETKDWKTENEMALCLENKQNAKTLADIHSQNIWQFTQTCLDDDTQKKIIHYTDKTRKTEFIIKDPEKFAEKWGKLKNKETMTVRKLSRSLAYLVKTKKKLRKISKWRFQINEDPSIDFVCSRVNSPWGSSSENTVDLQYEMDQLSPEINESLAENLINTSINASNNTTQHPTYDNRTPSPPYSLHDNITSHVDTVSSMASLSTMPSLTEGNADGSKFTLSQGSPISNNIKTIVNTLVTKGAFHSHPPLLALTSTTQVGNANFFASLDPEKCISSKTNHVNFSIENLETINAVINTSPQISYCVNPPLYVNNSQLERKQQTDSISADSDINMKSEELSPTYDIANLTLYPVENSAPPERNTETVLSGTIPLSTELDYSVSDLFGLTLFGLNYPEDENNSINNMSDFGSFFNDFTRTPALFEDISSSLIV